MIHSCMQSNKQRGFSIVELMVALLLGLFLVSGVTAMYISSKQSYRMTDNISRLQESLRFSLDFMSSDIRMAGYMPCRFPPLTRNAIDNADTGSNAWFLDYFNFGVRGYEGSAGGFPTDLPAVGTNAGDRVAGTDAIVILKASLYTQVSVHMTQQRIRLRCKVILQIVILKEAVSESFVTLVRRLCFKFRMLQQGLKPSAITMLQIYCQAMMPE